MSTLPVETFESIEESAPLTAEGLLRRRAEQRPGVAALADPSNLRALGFGEPRSFSYREADSAVDALASFFVELGLLPGDTIAVQLPNLAMTPLTCSRRGAPGSPLRRCRCCGGNMRSAWCARRSRQRR